MDNTRKFNALASLGLITKILSAGLGISLSIILARMLHPVEFGEYVLYIALINLITVLLLLGLPNLVSREIARRYSENGAKLDIEIYKKSIKMILITSFIISIISCIAVNWISIDLMVYINVIIISIMTAVSQINGSVLRGAHKPILADMPLLIVKPLSTIFLIVVMYLVVNELNLKILMLIVLFATLISLIISFIDLKNNEFVKKERVNFSGLKYFYFLSIIGLFELQIPIYALSILDSMASVANYQVAVQITTVMIFVILALNNQLTSKVSEAFQNKEINHLQILLNNSLKFSFIYVIFAFVSSILIIVNIKHIYGFDYVDSVGPAIILIFAQVANVLTGSSALVLNMSGNQDVTLKIMIVAQSVNIFGCLLLIPILSIYGAALSSFISIALWNSSLAIICYKKFGIKTYFRFEVLR